VEIGHPAHVHFFKNPINIWRKNGHKVVIVTRDKEFTHLLLDEMGVEYKALSKQRTGFLGMLSELLVRWIKIFLIIRKEKIDLAISISGISTSLPARLAGITAITDTDTEDAALTNSIAFRFSDIVVTPSTFLKKNKYKNIRTYESFHELAYLHPNWFKPSRESLKLFDIKKGDKYFFIRLVKWKALHDISESGIKEKDLKKLILFLKQKHYKVFLSSERALSSFFDKFLIKSNLSKIFDLMAFSYGYIGESPTMSVEAALMGKPSVLINSRVSHLGNMIELQEKYHLLYNFESFSGANKFIRNDLLTQKVSDNSSEARKRLLKEKIDISQWIADFSVNFCNEKIKR